MRHPGLYVFGSIVAAIAVGAAASAISSAQAKVVDAAGVTSPVLVELFTSEGCSSCPPADQLLINIQKADPDAVVLSEHVTYWNSIGWKDPFSSQSSTERQSDYVQRMGLSSSYTPQMVVNGRYEFVGSDACSAIEAIRKAADNAAIPISISDLKTTDNRVGFALETGTVNKDAQLMLVLAQDEGTEHVASGENGGRTLRHAQIARTIRQIASVRGDAAYKERCLLICPRLSRVKAGTSSSFFNKDVVATSWV